MPASETVLNAAIHSLGVSRQSITIVESEELPAAKQIPFIPEENSIVRIRVGNVDLKLNEGKTVKSNPFVKSFDLFYSVEQKQLIKVVSLWPDGVPGTRFPTLDVQEAEMKRVTQTFSGIPVMLRKLRS